MKITRQIDSPKNPLIKSLDKLKNRRHRDETKRYLIEGSKELSRALDAHISIEQILICSKLLKAESKLMLSGLNKQIEKLELSKLAFEKLSLRQNPDGVLAVAQMQEKNLNDLKLSENALILVIDGLEKPGNIGALLRTADAVKVDAVFITGSGTDLYNPNVIRSSVGSVFSQTVLAADAEALIAFLAEHKVQLIATSPNATQSFWQLSYTGSCAIILGTEHEGLGDAWFQAAPQKVIIPMHGAADSLNVATSGALLLYEALRQRSL